MSEKVTRCPRINRRKITSRPIPGARPPDLRLWFLGLEARNRFDLAMKLFPHACAGRHWSLWFVWGWILGISGVGARATEVPSTRPPNVVLILADDLGWSDLGCYGADLHETPRIDRLAREGVRFVQAYAPSPVCTPTRASLLTGKAPARLRMTIWSEGSLNPPKERSLLEAPSRHDLPLHQKTLARYLQEAGYLTAVVGKWHLGDGNHAPEAHGFDVNIGGTHWGAPFSFFWPYRGSGRAGAEFRYVPHLEFGAAGEYLTDRLTDEALRVIDRTADKPFFLFLAHHAPHTPIEAKPADVAYFEAKRRPGMHHQHAGYAAMIKSLDDSVGRVLARLEERGLASNTVVIFASDNGGYLGIDSKTGKVITSNAPLRSGKGSLYEGGLRVPLIVRWPGVTRVGATVETPVSLTDLFYTLMEAAKLRPAPAPQEATDGLSLRPLLENPRAIFAREALFFHYPHYYHAPKTVPSSAVREGDWKLIEYFGESTPELFDLKHDPAERNNLALAEPSRVDAMKRRLSDWRRQVDAALPTPNPAPFQPNPDVTR